MKSVLRAFALAAALLQPAHAVLITSTLADGLDFDAPTLDPQPASSAFAPL